MSAEATAAKPVATVDAPPKKKKKKFSVPTAFTILFVITILAVIATWFIPAGAYSKLAYLPDSSEFQITEPSGEVRTIPATEEAFRADPELQDMKVDVAKFLDGSITKPISVPGTYEELPQQPKGLFDVTAAMVNGTINGVDIMVFILVLGGLNRRRQRIGRLRVGPGRLDEEDQGSRVPLGIPRQRADGSRRHDLRPRGGSGRVLPDPRTYIPRFGI